LASAPKWLRLLLAAGLDLFHHLAHFGTVVAVEAVALDGHRFDVLTQKDVLERAFHRGGTGAGRTGDCDDRVLGGHGFSLRLL